MKSGELLKVFRALEGVVCFSGMFFFLRSHRQRRELRQKAEAELAKATEENNADNIEKFSKRTLRVTKQHNEDCQQLLTLMGVPWVVVGLAIPWSAYRV